MKLSIQQKIQAGFAAALAFLLLTGAATWWSAHENAAMSQLAEQTERAGDALDAVLADVLDSETGSRGYVITGNPAFLQPYQAGMVSVHRSLSSLKEMVRGNPAQQARVAELDPLIIKKLFYEGQAIQMRRSGDTNSALLFVATGQGKETMDEIRRLIEAAKADAEPILAGRTRQARTLARATLGMATFGSLLSLGLVATAGGMVRRDFARRQKAEAALRRSEENLTVTLHSIGDAVLATDTAGRVTRLNPIGEKLTGWTQAEALGRPVEEVLRILNEATRQPAIIPVEKALTTGQSQSLAYRTVAIARDGAERLIADTAAPIRDKEGRVLGVVLVFRDVTEDRQKEKALEYERYLLRTLMDKAPDYIYFKDRDSRLLRSNQAHSQRLGVNNPAQVIGKTDFDFFAPKHARQAYADEQEVMRSGQPISKEEMETWRDGHQTWALTSKMPLYDEQQQIIGTFGISHDITLRKHMEETLRQAQEETTRERERLQFIFDSVPVGIALTHTDLDGRETRQINQAHLNMCGLTREQVDEPGIFVRVTHPEDRAQQARFKTQIADGVIEDYSMDKRYLRFDGTILWVMFKFRRRRLDDGSLEDLSLVVDITARKKSENELEELNLGLERQANQLEAANKELESFSYSVSHDLRAPLRHVHGYGEMLARALDGHLAEEPRRFLNTILDASREMGELIDDLLAFSRINRGDLRRTAVDLDALVQDSIRGLEMAARGRNIVWKHTPLPRVSGDPALLKQVFANLLGNAVKFTQPRDTAVIEVGCAGEDQGLLILFVRDNGVGFDMKYARKLFGVFQRLHQAEQFEGTGIGLATVQRIVGRHGGRVWAQAELDRGATFYFTLMPAQ